MSLSDMADDAKMMEKDGDMVTNNPHLREGKDDRPTVRGLPLQHESRDKRSDSRKELPHS